MLLHTLF
jgi:hypothetical protein